ncbi:MAG: inositol monophosphatase [Thaumarchaeota archaeon]|jgi:myo-inositol-1(or 4)-monophosphatase|nr:MAG: inositol monophosphatase [Nitrososphaerota archaeon]HIA96846.1 inositol monophosphatase [Candidatus Nitrosopelagicus sp.]HIO85461.1 inositol monophosphatase [Candidatus Nitrosopelagicus sp.]
MNYTKELDVAKSVAKEMGKIQLKNFRKNLKVIRKSTKDFVSNVDLECQNLSYELLRKDFQYEILSEERKTQDEIGTKLFWIIDPVDGTHNYISGLPNFGVSIALATKKEFLLGVIYLPYFDEMYYAVKNQGAFMNDEKIQVSKNNDLEKSMITFDNQFYLNKKSFDVYKKIVDSCFTTRILGSAVYDFCLIASGKVDARVWNNTKVFDFAAGLTIVNEAGGKLTDFNGNEITLNSHDILASNSFVHQELLTVING